MTHPLFSQPENEAYWKSYWINKIDFAYLFIFLHLSRAALERSL